MESQNKMRSEKTAKKRVFEIIQIGSRTDAVSNMFDFFLAAVILVNIVTAFLLTYQELRPYLGLLNAVECATNLFFAVEYALRVWTAGYLYPEKKAAVARARFAVSFYGIIDLLTFLPWFLPFFFPAGAVAFRMLRVVRMFRLFRINTRYDAFHVITDVLSDKKNQLFSSVFLVIMLMLASSLCMYSMEHEAQPEAFRNAFSGIWWSVSTLLTVGYGDIYPITVGGRVMGIVIAFLGVGVVAIPTGIISAGFVEHYTRRKAGTFTQHDADFVTLDIPEDHPYLGKRLREIELPKGLYPAVVMRGHDVKNPYGDLILRDGDCLLLATTSRRRMEAHIEEVTLSQGHAWIDHRVRDLDISRQTFLLMVKRSGRVIELKGSTVLREEDVALLYTRSVTERL